MRLMSRPAPVLAAPVLAALALIGCAFSAPAARAQTDGPTDHYLALRRAYPPTPDLSPRLLAQNPAAYRGRTLELTGHLSGIVRVDDGAMLMLSTPQDGTLTLTMSQLPTWVQPGSDLRVLAVVTGDDTVVTIGTPDFKVVAVASKTDVAAAEYQWAQSAATRQARDRQTQTALARADAVLSGGKGARSPRGATLSSRGGGAISGGAISGGALWRSLSPAAQAVYPAYLAFIQKSNRRLSDRDADAITSAILLYSERWQVDPRLVIALVIAESDFHIGETSNKGAMGLGQLMPDEVRSLGIRNPYDPVENIGGAVYLLRGRLDKYSGGQDLTMQHIILALASYNAGMGAVKKYGGVPPYRETQNYVRKIERLYRQLCGQSPAMGS